MYLSDSAFAVDALSILPQNKNVKKPRIHKRKKTFEGFFNILLYKTLFSKVTKILFFNTIFLSDDPCTKGKYGCILRHNSASHP